MRKRPRGWKGDGLDLYRYRNPETPFPRGFPITPKVAGGVLVVLALGAGFIVRQHQADHAAGEAADDRARAAEVLPDEISLYESLPEKQVTQVDGHFYFKCTVQVRDNGSFIVPTVLVLKSDQKFGTFVGEQFVGQTLRGNTHQVSIGSVNPIEVLQQRAQQALPKFKGDWQARVYQKPRPQKFDIDP